MAESWIKVEYGTPTKPELFHVARRCNVTPEHAFGCWFKLWIYFDSRCESGEVNLFTKEDADRIAGLPGIGTALEEAHWLTFTESDHFQCCIITNWEKHNGTSAKKRAEDASRKRRERK